ncbi:hypothetical protein [Rhizobium metallidurans]|uniref:Uncharacterized protein n=1 Tax=Rhizobium metallidurans TaxID=1265931 RepID=A0A7W6CR62_9HYPH|nr:hypothetical protein [Rhizobium metallidurans]MBB3963472.1 hypothetical protein [Rhizobium metallidurans]
MQTALALSIVILVLYIAWSILAIPFSWKRRNMRLKRAGLGFCALIAILVALTIDADREARSLGFESATDQRLAKEAGINEPAAWAQQKGALLAKKKADDDAAAAAKAAARTAEDKASAKEAARVAAAEKESAARAEAEKAVAEKAEAEKCRQDLQCWGEKAWIGASVRCPEFIEKLAKWDFQWTDGTFEPKFAKYRWKDQKRGVVTLIGDKAKMQNGFGAWKRVTYTCDYDPIAEAVVTVDAN